MECRKHLAWLGIGLSLLATLAACGPDIHDVTARPAPSGDIAAPAAQGPTTPLLLESPTTDRLWTNPGGQVEVTVLAEAQRPLASVGVTLRSATGAVVGEGWLTVQDAFTWRGAVGVGAGAAPGSYAVEIILNDGPFVSGGTLTQSLYRFVPWASGTHYHAYTNGIAVEGSVYYVSPLPQTQPAPRLALVQVR